jgi:hypothetical protein
MGKLNRHLSYVERSTVQPDNGKFDIPYIHIDLFLLTLEPFGGLIDIERGHGIQWIKVNQAMAVEASSKSHIHTFRMTDQYNHLHPVPHFWF